MTDTEIIEGIKAFDGKAETELYKKHKTYCLAFMRRMHKNDDDNLDIYHDAMIVFIEKTRTDKMQLVNTSIQTYLNSICRYQLLTRFKLAARFTLVDDENSLFDESITDWLEDEELDERLSILMEELEKMAESGPACYELLKKFYFEKKSFKEIAILLNYSNDDSAKKSSSVCKKTLKKKILDRIN